MFFLLKLMKLNSYIKLFSILIRYWNYGILFYSILILKYINLLYVYIFIIY